MSRNDGSTGLLNLFHGMLLHTEALQRWAENVLTEDLGLTCVLLFIPFFAVICAVIVECCSS
jgi:hypothetical protein